MSISDRIDRLRHGWANLHPLMRVLGLAGLLAAVTYFGAKPAYQAFKGWRMERNLVAAATAVGERRMEKARDLSLAVLHAGDPGIEAIRILERSTESLGDMNHPEIARALIVHPDATVADRLKGFQGVVMDLPLGQLGQLWAALPDGLRARPEFATAFARRLIGEGRIAEAAEVLVAVPDEARNAELRQELARLLTASGSMEGFEEAQRMISVGLAGDDSAATAGWLDVLEEIPPQHLRVGLLHPVEELTEGLPGVGASRLALLRCRVALAAQGAERAQMLSNTIASWRAADPAGLARLLGDLGEDRLLLETIAPEDPKAGPELVRAMWRAASRVEAWESAGAWLEAHGEELPNYEREAYRAILAGKTGDAAASQLAWSEAVNEAKAGRGGHDLLAVHRLADEGGFAEAAATAMIEAIRTGGGPLPLYQTHKDLMCALSGAGRERVALEICAIYLALEPSNPVLLTQYAYLAYLHDVAEPGRLRPPLEALAAAYPDELPIHTTLAAILLADGQAAEAAKTLEPFGLEGKKLAPPFRVIHLASEVLIGRMAVDDSRITSFPWSELNVAERRKFGALIRGEISPAEP